MYLLWKKDRWSAAILKIFEAFLQLLILHWYWVQIMDDSVLRISLCGLSPDCEDLGFFQDVTRSPANFRCIQIDHHPNRWRFDQNSKIPGVPRSWSTGWRFISFVIIWNISSSVGLGRWTKIAKVVTMTSARRSCWPVRKARKTAVFLDVQLALVSFFLPMAYFSGNPHGKQPELSLHDFDHFRYDFLLKKNVRTWIFVDQDWPFEAPGNMDAAVTLIQVGQLQFTAETIREETTGEV